MHAMQSAEWGSLPAEDLRLEPRELRTTRCSAYTFDENEGKKRPTMVQWGKWYGAGTDMARMEDFFAMETKERHWRRRWCKSQSA